MNMIERVARAIRASVTTVYDWEEIGEGARNMYRKDARAAIEAMREPTEAMLNAGYGYAPDATGGAVYRAMIDAALQEGSHDQPR